MPLYYQPSNNGYTMGGPPTYPSSSVIPQNSAPAMDIRVNFTVNQYVDIRLDVQSPWTVGVVLAILTVAEKSFKIEYEIKYQVGNRFRTKNFPANSPNIRPPQC